MENVRESTKSVNSLYTIRPETQDVVSISTDACCAITLPDAESLKKLIRLIATSLVNDENSVFVETKETPSATVLVLTINASEIEKLVGFKGNVEHAIRNIVLDVGAKLGHRFRLEIPQSIK